MAKLEKFNNPHSMGTQVVVTEEMGSVTNYMNSEFMPRVIKVLADKMADVLAEEFGEQIRSEIQSQISELVKGLGDRIVVSGLKDLLKEENKK